jgi:ubiquinone/menaquinone biosynthesis C-methylase UbiE
MDITQEELINARFSVPAAPEDAWRKYDEQHPVPNYFDFDWLSSRHPDLYHKFALSSVGLINELGRMYDLSGLQVLDICAGTGRVTMGAAAKVRRVTALDAFGSVLEYGRRMANQASLAGQAGLGNIEYVRGDALNLPFPANSFDITLCSWAIISHPEAWRVLRPGGAMIDLVAAPGALCGELTPLLADVYPHLITEVAPAAHFDPSCPDAGSDLDVDAWDGVAVIPPVRLHDFTYVADYGDPLEAAAMIGRLYGPRAKGWTLDNQRSTLAWRLRIVICRVKKGFKHE